MPKFDNKFLEQTNAPPSSGLAIAGLVCGIIGICLGAGALSVAIVALVKANKAQRLAARKVI